MGVVKKNAIMMIDFALDAQRNEGIGLCDAIYTGCLMRFRPIMMTTMAALFGIIPIALGYGEGGDARQTSWSRRSRRTGGLATAPHLYITPVIYLYMEKFKATCARLNAPALAPPDTDSGVTRTD